MAKPDQRFVNFTIQVEKAFLAGNTKDAVIHAQEFQRLYPNQSLANYFLAIAYGRDRNHRLSLLFAERAYELEPQNIEYIYLLSRTYCKRKLYELAETILRQAIKNNPKIFRLHWALADYLFDIGNGIEAKRICEYALGLESRGESKLLLTFTYACCLSALSLIDEADQAFIEYGSVEHFYANALSRRSRLRKYLPSSDVAKLVIEKMADPKVSSKVRKELVVSLGVMHEHAGEYDTAFQLWTEAQRHNPTNLPNWFGRTAISKFIDFYSKQLFELARPYGHQSQMPLFVVGMPRSGTTLIEQVLDAHESCFGAGELGRIGNIEYEFRNANSGANYIQTVIQKAETNELQTSGARVLLLLEQLARSDVKYVVDKTPAQYLSMGLAALYFPNAKFIHMQRHPADSFISAFQNNMNEDHSYSYDQESYVEAYLAKEKLMAHWRSCFPSQIYDLQYERLVANPEGTVRDVLKFLDLPWDENCMQFFNKGKMVKTFSKEQVRNPIYTSSVYRWKNYEKHLGPFFAALKAANFEYPEA